MFHPLFSKNCVHDKTRWLHRTFMSMQSLVLNKYRTTVERKNVAFSWKKCPAKLWRTVSQQNSPLPSEVRKTTPTQQRHWIHCDSVVKKTERPASGSKDGKCRRYRGRGQHSCTLYQRLRQNCELVILGYYGNVCDWKTKLFMDFGLLFIYSLYFRVFGVSMHLVSSFLFWLFTRCLLVYTSRFGFPVFYRTWIWVITPVMCVWLPSLRI